MKIDPAMAEVERIIYLIATGEKMSETTKNLQQENKMGVMPVNRLIISMS